jgi:hypothetical protein
MPDHDSLYHRLFDHPGVVAELLREFVDGPWLDDLDLGGMTRENAKFHAGTGDRRDGDMVWRIPRRQGGDTYLLLLLEFQSTQDRWMALRVMVYAGLLWQHLVNEKRLPPDGRLPPILPVVLYNGDGRWAPPLALRDLIGLPDGSLLWDCQPAMRHLMVDEGAFPEDNLAQRDALLALLFRLERSPGPAQAVAVADALVAWFSRHPGFERVQPVFVDMLSALLAPFVPDVRVPDKLVEVRNMLATRWEFWTQQESKRIEERVQKGLEERFEERVQERVQERLEERVQERLQAAEEQAVQKGRREGRQDGEAALLLRQLERRFGVLPGWARDRIAAADTAALEEWGLRILDGGRLEDVLA